MFEKPSLTITEVKPDSKKTEVKSRPEQKEAITEKEAKELVESLEGGVFLGTEEIKEAFAQLIPDDLKDLPLPDKEKIEKVAETFKELGYNKWALIRMVSEDKEGLPINIKWLNKRFKTDPKNPDTKLINQEYVIGSTEEDNLKVKAQPLEDKWALVALDCPMNSATANKTNKEQEDLVNQTNQEKGLNLYTPQANEDVYAYLAAYLKTGQKLRQETWLRTDSYSTYGSVMVGHADDRGLRLDTSLYVHSFLNTGRALACSVEK